MANSRGKRDEGKARFWHGQIEGQARSGLSVRAYCRAHGLRESAYYFWRKALARRKAQTSPPFVPVTVASDGGEPSGGTASAGEEAGCGRIEILVANGRRIQVTGPVDRQALAAVLAVVEGRAC